MFGRALDSPWHLIILAVVVVVLFGGKRLPEAARGLGRSMRIFKSEMKQMNDDGSAKRDDGSAKRDDSSAKRQEPASPSAPQPLEGRVMDSEPRSSTAPTEQRRDT